MTNEKLDQILKQALTPEIDDSEIQIRRKARKNMMSKKIVIAGGIGLAACATLIFAVLGGYHGTGSKMGEEAVSYVEAEQNKASTNLFAITAHAAELPEGVESGDVIGLRLIEADQGSPSFLNGRFAISGDNIDVVKVTTDKCNIYTSVPIYNGDPDYGNALNFENNANECYEPVFKDFPEGFPEDTDGYLEYYDHCLVAGQSYEGEHKADMSFGMSVPEELWSASDDPKKGFWEDVDQVDGAMLTIEVTFNDGSTQTHHYKLNTGKIFIPVDEEGTLQWDNLTRFLTEDEEDSAPFTYGYLINKLD